MKRFLGLLYCGSVGAVISLGSMAIFHPSIVNPSSMVFLKALLAIILTTGIPFLVMKDKKNG